MLAITRTKSRNKTKLRLAAANAAVAIALATDNSYRHIARNIDSWGNGPLAEPLHGIALAIAIVMGNCNPSEAQFQEALVAAKLLRADVTKGDRAAQHIDDCVFWWNARRAGITAEGRAIVRAAGHHTEWRKPARGVPLPH